MKIIINRSDDSLDSVLCVSMVKMIKDKYMDASVIVLASPKNSAVFKNSQYIDDVYEYDRSGSIFYKIRAIYNLFEKLDPTHYVYAGGGFTPNFIAWVLRVAYRGGLKAKWHTYLFLNKGVMQSRSVVTMHEVEYNLNLLNPMGLIYNYQNFERYLPEINFTDEELVEINEDFISDLKAMSFNPQFKRVFFYPGMIGNSLNWSASNYGRLIQKFANKYSNDFIFIIPYFSTEHAVIEELKRYILSEISEELQKNIYLYDISSRSLRHFIGMLKSATLYVGANTGLTHVAAAVGVPVISLFSPIKTQSVLRWKPLSKNAHTTLTLVPDVICGELRECVLKQCPYYECMNKIEAEDVLLGASRIMDLK